MGKACMFMTLLTEPYKLFLAETQDNAFGWVRLWVSTTKWKKCPTLNKSWGVVSCQVACPFFAKLCFGWFMVQHLSRTEFPDMVYQAKQQKLEERSVMIFLTQANWCQPSCCYHPNQFQFLFPESSEHCGNKDTLLLIKAMPNCFNVLPLWETTFLDSCLLQNRDPIPVRKSLSRCCNFQPLALLCYDHNQPYWIQKCTFSKDIGIYFYIATLNIFIWANLIFHQPPKPIQAIHLKTALSSLIR